jgi:hypothetical protein
MYFLVSHSNLVNGELAIGSKTPQKASWSKPLGTEVGRFRSVDVFVQFVSNIVSSFAVILKQVRSDL